MEWAHSRNHPGLLRGSVVVRCGDGGRGAALYVNFAGANLARGVMKFIVRFGYATRKKGRGVGIIGVWWASEASVGLGYINFSGVSIGV
jgi:hypothetical protein